MYYFRATLKRLAFNSSAICYVMKMKIINAIFGKYLVGPYYTGPKLTLTLTGVIFQMFTVKHITPALLTPYHEKITPCHLEPA